LIFSALREDGCLALFRSVPSPAAHQRAERSERADGMVPLERADQQCRWPEPGIAQYVNTWVHWQVDLAAQWTLQWKS
jgi:hypothetical protein